MAHNKFARSKGLIALEMLILLGISVAFWSVYIPKVFFK